MGWRVLSLETADCRRSNTTLCFSSVTLELDSHIWLRHSPCCLWECWAERGPALVEQGQTQRNPSFHVS